ncbi:MAG: hypothetical protein R2693_14195 [Nocardioidaceae bacterium]
MTVNATLVGQRQNEETQRLTEAQFAQRKEAEDLVMGSNPVCPDPGMPASMA